jgi:hypothetical protein
LRQLAESFSATLASVGVFDAVTIDSIRPPLHTQFGVVIADAAAGAHTEFAAKFVSSIGIGSGTLQSQRSAGLIIVSDDLLKSAAPARKHCWKIR